MNKKQWRVLSVGFFIFGFVLLNTSNFGCFSSGDLLIACYIRKYAYGIPGLMLVFFGILFSILAEFESMR